MGKFATRRALKSLLSRAQLTLYRHQLDGASYQYYAGGVCCERIFRTKIFYV